MLASIKEVSFIKDILPKLFHLVKELLESLRFEGIEALEVLAAYCGELHACINGVKCGLQRTHANPGRAILLSIGDVSVAGLHVDAVQESLATGFQGERRVSTEIPRTLHVITFT